MHKHTVRFIQYLVLTLCLLAINGCGQKGDLYLPDQASLVEDLHSQHI